MGLKLLFFGAWQASLEGKTLPTSRVRRAEGLLAYLAQNQAYPHSRQSLDHFFFPNSLDNARMRLRQELTRLRRLFGNHADYYLNISAEHIQLIGLGNVYLDTQHFETLINGCPQHSSSEINCQNCIANLRSASALYRGSFLQDITIADCQPFEDWASMQRLYWQARFLACMKQLITYHAQRGEHEQACADARRLLMEDPWDEDVHRQLMRLLAQKGSRGTAIAHYYTCVETLRRDLDMEPAPETVALYERIKALPEKRPFHLLPPHNSFLIGRQSEFATVLQHLSNPSARLLTILGSGGVGKTSLATAVTHHIAHENFGPFMDGVFAVQLNHEEINGQTLLIKLAQTIEIKIHNRLSIQQQVWDALRKQECLIFLDNGEFLTASGRNVLSELLQNAPHSQILVTSRKRLDLDEEITLLLEGLPYADATDYAARFAATKLIVAHAKQTQLNLRIEPEEWKSITRITQLTAGLPLALKLATSWRRVMGFADIADEIDKGIEIFKTTKSNIPERHRSMRVVFNQSWHMLSASLKQLLKDLSVFSGQFEWHAANKITKASRIELMALVDRSLLQTAVIHNTTVYNLHPLLLQYVQEEMDTETALTLQNIHSVYYGDLIELLCEKLDSHEMKEAIQTLERNFTNIQRGWQTVVNNQAVIEIGRYASAIHDLFTICGWPLIGRDFLRQAAQLVENDVLNGRLPAQEARAWSILFSRLGEFNQTLGQLQRAEEVLKISQALAYLIEDPIQVAFVHKKLGRVAFRRGDLSLATNLLSKCRMMDLEAEDFFSLALTDLVLGAIAYEKRAFKLAFDHFVSSEHHFRALNVQWGLGHALRWLGITAHHLAKSEQALNYFLESEALCRKNNDQIGLAMVLWQRGAFEYEQQHFEQAFLYLKQSLKLADMLQDVQCCFRVHLTFAHLYLQLSKYDLAKKHLQSANLTIGQFEQPILLLKLSVAVIKWVNQTQTAVSLVEMNKLVSTVKAHPAYSPTIQHLLHQLPQKQIDPQTDNLHGNFNDSQIPLVLTQLLQSNFHKSP